jgi:hypothetical protein
MASRSAVYNCHSDQTRTHSMRDKRLRGKFSPSARLALAIGLLALVVLVAACARSHSTNTNPTTPDASQGNKAALCKFDEDINEAGKSANSQKQYLQLLKSFEPRFDQAIADAPPTIRPDVETLISGLRRMIQTNSISVDSATAHRVDQAGNNLDAYCSIN